MSPARLATPLLKSAFLGTSCVRILWRQILLTLQTKESFCGLFRFFVESFDTMSKHANVFYSSGCDFHPFWMFLYTLTFGGPFTHVCVSGYTCCGRSRLSLGLQWRRLAHMLCFLLASLVSPYLVGFYTV